MRYGCVACARGFHDECSLKKGCKKCHSKIAKNESSNESPSEVISVQSDGPRRRKSAKENLKDPASTGRKRAAELYKLDRSAACEWRNQRNCGGGLRPIVGCYDGNQQHRHHGPVKDTTRNELGNVHRICSSCHVHWHELNDLVYDPRQFNLLPHQPEPATPEVLVENKLAWETGAMGKKFELASTKNREKHEAKHATRTVLHSPDIDED